MVGETSQLSNLNLAQQRSGTIDEIPGRTKGHEANSPAIHSHSRELSSTPNWMKFLHLRSNWQ
jgi:hypothetical protein